MYKARDREMGAVVALKVLHPEIAGRAELIERFKSELLLARKVTHKNVCRVYDLNRLGDVAAISMEYIEGESLRVLLDRPQGISIRHGLHLVRQIMAGLAEAHAQGVVHRDLKPENILIGREGTAKVMDFGIARSLDSGATLTGTILGTPAYMSPEQVSGKTADTRSDIYSLGLMMYEMFSGRRAFIGDTPLSIATKQVQETPPEPIEFDHHLPAFLNRVILKCIEKDPARRFQSIAELETALFERGELVTSRSAGEDLGVALPAHLTLWQRNDSALVFLAIGGLVGFFVLFGATSFAPRSPVSFDRSVLRRIAQEYAQKLGAPIDGESRIRVSALRDRYDYIASVAGARTALEMTNNLVPYWLWRVEWKNGTVVTVDNQGRLQDFYSPRIVSGQISLTDDLMRTAESIPREVLDQDPANPLRLESTNSEFWRGNPSILFIWQDSKDYGGLRRRVAAHFSGKDIAGLETQYDRLPGHENVSFDVNWQLLPVLVPSVVLLIVGFFQRHLVDLNSRWRIFTIAVVSVNTGLSTWFTSLDERTSATILISVLQSLAMVFLMFYVFVAIEAAVRRTAPGKLATLLRLFGRGALAEPCGLAIVRGTLIGFALAGLDRFLIWGGTTFLGIRLDSSAMLWMQGLLYLTNPLPSAELLLYSLFQGFGALLLSLFVSMFGRERRRSQLPIVVAAALTAIFLASPVYTTLAGVQPYPGKVVVLLCDFLLVSWAFIRFDVLTSIVAIFTCVFFFQNYSLLVMFKPTGSLEQWLTFAVWGSFVLAATAIACKSSVIAAGRRVTAAFRWN